MLASRRSILNSSLPTCLLCVSLISLISLIGCSEDGSGGKAEWPTRPIQITCFAAPGGGTDTVDRTIARAMEPLLGVRINVVNKKGARGGEAIRDVWSREHDGYRWGGFSETILPAPVMNVHVDQTAKDWVYFMVAGAPGVISVAPDSKHASLEELVAAAKSAPGGINAAAANVGGIWHTKLLALEKAAGIRFNFIPFDGSHPSQIALLSGEVEVALTSISEQTEMVKAGKLRPLAMAEAEPYEFPGHGSIPAAGGIYPASTRVPVTQWLGFALPVDTPPDVLQKITRAFEQAMRSDAIRAMIESRLLTAYGYHGEKAGELARQTERAWMWMLHDLGIAERSPDELGIARPPD